MQFNPPDPFKTFNPLAGFPPARLPLTQNPPPSDPVADADTANGQVGGAFIRQLSGITAGHIDNSTFEQDENRAASPQQDDPGLETPLLELDFFDSAMAERLLRELHDEDPDTTAGNVRSGKTATRLCRQRHAEISEAMASEPPDLTCVAYTCARYVRSQVHQHGNSRAGGIFGASRHKMQFLFGSHLKMTGIDFGPQEHRLVHEHPGLQDPRKILDYATQYMGLRLRKAQPTHAELKVLDRRLDRLNTAIPSNIATLAGAPSKSTLRRQLRNDVIHKLFAAPPGPASGSGQTAARVLAVAAVELGIKGLAKVIGVKHPKITDTLGWLPEVDRRWLAADEVEVLKRFRTNENNCGPDIFAAAEKYVLANL